MAAQPPPLDPSCANEPTDRLPKFGVCDLFLGAISRSERSHGSRPNTPLACSLTPLYCDRDTKGCPSRRR